MKLCSNTENIHVTAEILWQMLIHLPQNKPATSIPHLTDWTITDNGCCFTLSNMLHCTLQLQSQTPHSKVVYQIDTDKNISAIATFLIQDNGADAQLTIEAETNVPLFMQAMIRKPLEQALNKSVVAIKTMAENQ